MSVHRGGVAATVLCRKIVKSANSLGAFYFANRIG